MIIEDNCFIGARSEVVEGVIVGENSVISMGVFLGQSTKIYDRETGEVHYGRVPPGSVVVAGSLPSKDGSYSLYAAIHRQEGRRANPLENRPQRTAAGRLSDGRRHACPTRGPVHARRSLPKPCKRPP